MKVPSIIIVMGAMVALAAPTAANARIAPEFASTASTAKLVSYYPSGVSLKKAIKKHGGTNVSQKQGKGDKGGTGKVKPVRPILIWVQGGQGGSLATNTVDECQTYMVGCTPEQACAIWGDGCHLLELPQQAVVAAESSSTSSEQNGSTGNLASSEIASAESPASDAATPIAQVANVIEENWDC